MPTKMKNRLTKREMDSLTAICDTFLPSEVTHVDDGDDSLKSFYATSASMAGTPDHLGRLLSGGIQHPALGTLRVGLWFLSTWYGTLVMCGRHCLSESFPFFPRKFSGLRRDRRERILLSWSLSSFSHLRMLFNCLKYVVMRTYFAQVNEKNENPSWKALGYPGPDPTLFQHEHEHEREREREDDILRSSLLLMDSSTEAISRKLHKAGFPHPTTSSPSPTLTLHCDAVVVGSGSGGSVVAGVLASAGHKVLVLEKGNYYSPAELSLLEGRTTSEMYEGGGLIATDDVAVLLLAGSTVGGGSTVNWSASIRTPEHVRKEWCRERGLGLFGSEVFDHALDVVCDRMGVQSEVLEEGFNNEVLRRGCVELGYPVSSVPCNAPPDHYCGWCHFGCKSGKKKSTQVTWLADLARSGNGLILPGCKALKVVHERKAGTDRNAATGVLAESLATKETFLIRSKVTVVACGALNTPGLLKRSGLTNRNIGSNLHLHPTVMAWGYFPPPFPDAAKRSYEGGILTSMSTVAANFETSGYGAVLQTPALHPGMFSLLTPWLSAADFRGRMARFSRTAHVFALVRDKGSGRAHYPEALAYRLEEEDRENLWRGLEAALRLLAAAGAAEVGTHYCGGERFEVNNSSGNGNEGEVERLVGEVRRRWRRRGTVGTPISTAHQMGSCRMGVGPEEGAVGPDGEAWEVEGLYLADTSVFPTALGVNPMVTVQAIAHCTAQSILRRLRAQPMAKEEVVSTP